MIRGLLLDLSGTLYQGREVVPGAVEAVRRLAAADLPVRYVTNTSRTPTALVREKLERLGFELAGAELFTAPAAVCAYLAEHELRPYLLVHPELEVEFADFSRDEPNAVVVADAAEAFEYASLNQAFRLLLDGAELLAVGDNRYFRDEGGMSLDAGPFVRALEYAAGCEARILGKPAADFFHAALAGLNCSPDEVLMVGDDVAADVRGALDAGLQGALVRTGKYRQGDEEQLDAAAWVCADITEVVGRLLD